MAFNLHPFRQAGLDFFEGAVEAVREFEGIGSWLFLDAENHRRLAVVRTDTPFGRRTNTDIGNVSYQYRLPIMDGNHGVRDVIQHVDTAQALNQVFLTGLHIKTGRSVLVRVP
jgi:hypothetical protein